MIIETGIVLFFGSIVISYFSDNFYKFNAINLLTSTYLLSITQVIELIFAIAISILITHHLLSTLKIIFQEGGYIPILNLSPIHMIINIIKNKIS